MNTIRSSSRIAIALAAGLAFAGTALAAPAASGQTAQMQQTGTAAQARTASRAASPELIRQINQTYHTQFRVPAPSNEVASR